MKRIGVLTVARSDYGILRPILKAVLSAGDLSLSLYVTAAHLSREFGLTWKIIEEDGFPVSARIETPSPGNSALDAIEVMGAVHSGLGLEWSRNRPDILLLTGDRYEMLCAAVAAAVMNIPVAHIHGGELSMGSADDMFRHALTKLSHLHFAATEEYARRIRRLGEEAWRITVSGAPALDAIYKEKPVSRTLLQQTCGIDVVEAPLVVSYHQPTIPYPGRDEELPNLLAALERLTLPVVFIYAGADPGGCRINKTLECAAMSRTDWRVVSNLPPNYFYTLMRSARAMIGNSSAGIVEAASFSLPVVNIGRRQLGRMHGPNVINVPNASIEAICQALEITLSASFRKKIQGIKNPYGNGNAAEIIINVLRKYDDAEKLLNKRFISFGQNSCRPSY